MKHRQTVIALAIDLCLNFLVFPGCKDIFVETFALLRVIGLIN